MSTFSDQLSLRFLDDVFVKDFLENQVGLQPLFDVIYERDELDLKAISLQGVARKQFQAPAFETLRTLGTEEKIMPGQERVQVSRTQPRRGRLEWVDVLLEIRVNTQMHVQTSPVERVTVENLLTKLGGAATLNELRAKLKTLYVDSVVDAFFQKFRITSLEEFKRRGSRFLEFVGKTPPPFNPADPQSARAYRLNVCVQFQPDLKAGEALRSAKLCRSILENEQNHAQMIEGGEVRTPYAFVVAFANAAVVDNAIPGLTAAQIKVGMKSLFASEGMLVHFA